jgi:CheY-like chemotaxis protein
MPKKVILCVDDEKIILTSLKGQFKKHFGGNYQYEFAESAEEAIEVIEDLDAENAVILLIVSDWLMPGIRGDEFLIDVHKKYPQIVKVMLSGQADEGAVERTRRQGGLYRYLSKPWREEDLIEIITAGLEQR